MSEISDIPSNVLVVGVDASGKSTFLESLSTCLGYVSVEPTSSPEAKKFKSDTIDISLSAKIIDEREHMYLQLNAAHEVAIAAQVESGKKVVTTGNRLVTVLSHAVMRQVISVEPSRRHHINVVEEQLAHLSDLPDAICFTYAPFAVIKQRIVGRQNEGDQLERFWGFNAPLFLERYQEAWHDALVVASNETDIVCHGFDTSVKNPDVMLDDFMTLRVPE